MMVKIDIPLLRDRMMANVASGDMVMAALDELERLRRLEEVNLSEVFLTARMNACPSCDDAPFCCDAHGIEMDVVRRTLGACIAEAMDASRARWRKGWVR